jgi:hypothetical protein
MTIACARHATFIRSIGSFYSQGGRLKIRDRAFFA